jgi:hypothetical protein
MAQEVRDDGGRRAERRGNDAESHAEWTEPGKREGPAPSAAEIHRAAVSHLHGEFARAVRTAELIAD